MSANRCSRCRREGLAPFPDNVAPPSSAFTEASGDGWTTVEGQDVCPRCQTDEERAVARRRIVASIEAEVRRREAAGIAPDPLEAGLVAYAMGMRDAEAPDPGGPVPGPGAGEDATADQETGTRTPPVASTPIGGAGDAAAGATTLRVALTGAFLTGVTLSVPDNDYGELQRQLGGTLSTPQWRVEGLRSDGGTYVSGGGFASDVPLVVAQRDGADRLPWLRAAAEGARRTARGAAGRPPPLLQLEPDELRIDVYDLGVAVVIAWFDVVARADAELGEVARSVKQLVWLRSDSSGRSPLAEALQEFARGTTSALSAAVTAAELETQPAWLSVPGRDRPAEPHGDENHGRLLWLHPICLVQTLDSPRGRVRELAPTFSKRIGIDGGVFAAGVGWSAIVGGPGSIAARLSDLPIRLTLLHWAYYALYMEIDRGLLALLAQPQWMQPDRLKRLESQADTVFGHYLRVMNARARLDSRLSGLGGDESAVWETIGRVQQFGAVVEAVKLKLDVLVQLAERRVAQASAHRERRVSEILGFLAALTIVAVTSAVLGTAFAEQSPLVLDVARGRILFVASLLALAIAVVILLAARGQSFARRPGRESLRSRR